MFFKQWLQSSTVRLALIAMVLCSVTLLGARSTGQAKAAAVQSAAGTPLRMASSEATQPDSSDDAIVCSVLNTGTVLHGSVLVHCTPGNGAIDWWSVPTTDTIEANRALSVALSAQAMNHKVWIGYDPSDQNLPSGCNASNCRRILWIETTEFPAN